MKKVKKIVCVLDGKVEKAVRVTYTDDTTSTYNVKNGEKFGDALKSAVREGKISLKGYNTNKGIEVVQLHTPSTESVKETAKKEQKLEEIVVEAKKFEKDINRKAKGVANVDVNVTAYDENHHEKKKGSGKYVLAAIGGAVLVGTLAFVAGKGCSKDATPVEYVSNIDENTKETPEKVTEIVVSEENSTNNNVAQENAIEVVESSYDVNVFDDITDQNKINARAESIYEDIYSAVKGTTCEAEALDVYSLETIDKMLNYFNDGTIMEYQAGDSLELMNLVDGLTNLEGELNTVLPLYKFQLDGTKGYEVAFETYLARIYMMNGYEVGVQNLAYNLYEVFVMPGLNGSVSVTSLESAGAKAFNLKYIMASNGLARETNEEVTFRDFCGNGLTWKELNVAVNEGKELRGHDEKISVPLTVEGAGCVEITYLSSYCMGADQEMLIKNQDQSKVLSK